MPTSPNTAHRKAYMREYRKRQEYKASKKAARVSVKPAPPVWTPEKLAAAAIYVAAMQAGRNKAPRCLGPDDVPDHVYFSADGRRICPKCTQLIKERNLSARSYTMSCSPLE